MTTIPFDRFLARLSAQSEQSGNDPRYFEWPDSLDPDAWYFSPELVSLYGTDAWRQLDTPARKRLAFHEAVNFFSLNVHGEKYLVSELARQAFLVDEAELSRYLLHFIAEETRHMQYFAGFCHRYAGGVARDRGLPPTDGGDREFTLLLLFARINVFEEIVDEYNATMAADERLATVVREINRIHHEEELRHLAFGRRFLADCVARYVSGWPVARRDRLRRYLGDYVDYTWQLYSNPDVYRDAGLSNPYSLWRSAAGQPTARARRQDITKRRLRFLQRLDLLAAT